MKTKEIKETKEEELYKIEHRADLSDMNMEVFSQKINENGDEFIYEVSCQDVMKADAKKIKINKDETGSVDIQASLLYIFDFCLKDKANSIKLITSAKQKFLIIKNLIFIQNYFDDIVEDTKKK